MNAKSNPLTVALVSTNSAVIEAVRKACFDEAGNAIRLTVTEDAEKAQQEASDQETACVLLDCSINGWSSPKHLKKLGAKKESAPLLLLGNDNWADAERAMNEANAADVLTPSDLTPGGLRRALRYALARRDSERAQPVLYRNFAQRIKALMRASDTVATFERSQIVVLAESMPRVEDVQIVAAKILSDINAPVAFEDRYLSVSAAIGIALYPTSGSTAEALIGRASQALTSAMERPTNKFVFV